jgi:flagellar basal body rod protein FlgC
MNTIYFINFHTILQKSRKNYKRRQLIFQHELIFSQQIVQLGLTVGKISNSENGWKITFFR